MDGDLNVTKTFTGAGYQKQSRITGPRGPRPNEVPVLALEGLRDTEEEDCALIPVAAMPSSPLSAMSWGTEPLAPSLETWYGGEEDTLQRNTPLVGYQNSPHSSYLLLNNPPIINQPKPAHVHEHHPQTQTSTIHTRIRKLEAEGLSVEKKKQTVTEQMMVDQLSRAVISEPEQNSANPVNMSACHKRTLHHTMVKTQKSLTENLLSHKLSFHARILSRCGREACRELIGFFFTCDHSLTVYEYRSFGKKRCSALPFITRGVYKTRGRLYCLADFSQGADLRFSTDVPHIPDSLRQRPYLTLRVTDVEEEAKSFLLYALTPTHRAQSGETANCLSEKELNDQTALKAIQGAVRDRLRGHAVQTLVALGRKLEYFDLQDKGKGKLRECLKEELSLSYQDFETVWRIVSQQGEVPVDGASIIRAVTGEMSEARKAIFIKVYVKLDPNKTGSVSLTDIEKFYCAKKNLEYGAKTDFLSCIRDAERVEGKVVYAEFEDYYDALSIEVPSEQDFISVLSSTWNM